MKKVFTILSLILPLLFSCSSDEDNQYVEFDKSELEVGPESNGYVIDITANCHYEILSDGVDWINIAPPSDSPSELTYIRLTIKENTTYSDRYTVITAVSQDGSSISKVKITQKENKGIISENECGEFDGEKQNITVDIKTNIDNPSIDTPEWITNASKGRALSDRSYQFMLSKNETGSERVGKIVFSGEGKYFEYTVKQKSIRILPSKITFKEGESIVLDSNSDFIMTPVFSPVECTEKDLEWTSSNTNVVTVSNGVLKVVGNGEAKVVAKSKLANVSASINVTVKIEARQIMLMDGTAQMSSETNWTFGYKTKIKFGSIPENAYLGDVFITSSNESVVSIVDGYLIANSNEGTSRIDIYDRYSLLHTIVNITVKRCITQGGFKLINQNSDALMMSFAGTIQNSKGVEVLGASLVDSSNRVLALADNIGTPSDIVQFSTKIINMTSLFGIYVIHEYDFPKLRFLVSYRFGSDPKIYQEYIDIDPFKQIGW